MTVHYIWIGPPTSEMKEQSSILPGQDTCGVKAMSSHCQEINFWCLSQHTEYYHECFAKFKNVKICPIQSYLDKNLTYDPEALYVKSTLEKILGKDRNLVRDRVTFKELLALYLLQKEGGFVLDTNIFPSPNSKVKLDDEPNKDFKMVSVNGQDEEFSQDVWLQYAKPETKRAKSCLEFWKTKFEYLDKVLQLELDNKPAIKYPEWYHNKLGQLVIAAPRLNDWRDSSAPQQTESIGFFKALRPLEGDLQNAFMTIPGLNIEKWYFNSHKYEHMPSVWQIYIFIQAGRADMIELFLDDANDYSKIKPIRFSEDLLNVNMGEEYSLLLHAVICRHVECINLLLSKGCNPFDKFFNVTTLGKAINCIGQIEVKTLEAILQPLVKLLNELNNPQSLDDIFQHKDYKWKHWDKYKNLITNNKYDDISVMKQIMIDMLEGCNHETFRNTISKCTSITDLTESFKSQMKKLKSDLKLGITTTSTQKKVSKKHKLTQVTPILNTQQLSKIHKKQKLTH